MDLDSKSSPSSFGSDVSQSPRPGSSRRQVSAQTDHHDRNNDSHSPADPTPLFSAGTSSTESSSSAREVQQDDLRITSNAHQSSISPSSRLNADQSVPTASQIYPEILKNPYANPPSGESTYFTRPNRYFGPASTWRSWTEADRAVPASLERLRAEDLGIHLHNAYSLRRRGEASKKRRSTGWEAVNTEQNLGDHEQRNDEGGAAKEDDEEADEFIPPRIWTVWPLPPDIVPREEFLKSSHDARSVRKPKDTRPSANLEECLIACATRHAKERWERREWADESEKQTKTVSKIKKEKNRTSDVTMIGFEPTSPVVAEPRSTPSADIHVRSSSESSSSPGVQGNVKYFSSQVFAPPSPTTSSDHSNRHEDSATSASQRPVFTADDEYARTLLLPSTRHIISKLEDLLMAAHHSRQSYAYGRASRSTSHARNESKTPMDPAGRDIERESANQTNVRGTSEVTPHPSQSRSRKRRRTVSQRMASSQRSPSRSRSTRRSATATLQPHDWSSIMGLAAITGAFPSDTLRRASERCARLFGENMLMRTFHEANPSSETRVDGIEGGHGKMRTGPWFEDNFILSDDDDDDDNQDLQQATYTSDSEIDKVAISAQTIETIRSSAACIRCYEEKRRCDPAPGATPQATVTSCQACLREGESCSGIFLRTVKVTGPTFVCPYEKCGRHNRAFRKNFNLQRHITLAHGGVAVPPTLEAENEQTRSRDRSSYNTPREEVFCPVAGCARAKGGQPFRRGHPMYEHVKKVHRDVDLEHVKMNLLQQRGERRGRWTDERRHRSRSEHSRSKSRRRQNTDDDDDDFSD